VRSFAALAAAAVAAMLCQTTLLPVLPGLPVVPDITLVLAVYLGVSHATVGGALGVFLLGYFLDTFSGTVLGVNAFTLTAVYVGVQGIARHLWLERGLPAMAIVFFGALLRDLATATIGGLVAAGAPVWQHVVGTGFIAAVAASLVAPAVFAVIRWEKRLLGLT